MYEIRLYDWRYVAQEGDDKKEIHALRWDIYVKEKEELIKRYFSVFFPDPKGRNIVWNCVKDHITEGKDQYRAIGLHGFDYTLSE